MYGNHEQTIILSERLTLTSLLAGAALLAFVELDHALDAAPLAVFEPSPALVGFMTDPHRFILVRAANQIGKTYQGCARLARTMLENPGRTYRAIGPNNRQTHKVLGGYLATFLRPHLAPGSYYTPGRGWNNNTIRLANGSTCELLSSEGHPQTHAGPALDGILMDEVPKPAIFTESLSRLTTKNGFFWVLMTPVDRPVEWYRDIVEAEGSKWREYTVEYCHANVPWKTFDEVQEHLDAMASAPWHYQQRVFGAWDGVTLDRFYMGLSDANFAELDIRQHVWNIGLTFDHGERAGSEVCLLVLYRPQEGMGYNRPMRWHVLDEYVSDRSTSIDEDAEGVRSMLRAHGITLDEVDLVTGDTNTAKSAAGEAKKVNEMLEHAFAALLGRQGPPFRIQDAEKHLGQFGRRLTNQLLRHGDLTIDPRCTETARCLRHWKGKEKGDDGELKHIPDALRYFLTRAARGQLAYDRLRF